MKKIMLLIAFVLITGCIQEDIIILDEVEITEYEGKELSSVNDFRENSIKGPQYIPLYDYRLEVTGLVDEPKIYTYDEVLDRQKYSKVVKLTCVEGWSVTILWEGILLRDLLDEAGPSPEANTVIFHAYDGYSTSHPLSYFYDKDIIMAYRMNNVTVPPERGYPFVLVAEDKWGYKWIKWITKIELTDDPEYRGYWESAGYSQKGDYGGPIFD
ncbi:molybdopterin-dependent oxidoreductase [archaeon]|nr:molybdopterin-dependent oxidoreductase [archaeon]